MLRLLLNKKEAVIKADTSFKFNIENQVLSEQGSYSLQITLPLYDCTENKKIFGAINRSDMNIENITGEYELMTELFRNSGRYKITDINEKEVKIQLLANKTLANYNCKNYQKDQKFIDEIPLGDFLDEDDLAKELLDKGDPSIAPEFEKHPRNIEEMVFYLHYAGSWRTHALPPRTTCVTFPIASTAEENTRIVNEHISNGVSYVLATDIRVVNNKYYNTSVALQPQLLEIVRRIYKYLGFDFKSNLSEEATYTFIANSKCTIHYRDILPHWTIKDFLKEICNFFGAIVIIDDKIATIEKRSDYYMANEYQFIKDVVEEYTTKCEEDNPEGTEAIGNVDYEWPEEDNQLRIPDEIYEMAEIRKFKNKAEIEVEVGMMKQEEKALSHCLYVTNDGNKYALLENDTTKEFQLQRVDYYPPLIRNEQKRDIDTKIKIVPVRMKSVNMNFIKDIPIMAVADTVRAEKIYSVNNAIKPNSEAAINSDNTEKRDVIEVFYHDAGISVIANSSRDIKEKNFISPLGVMLENNPESGLLEIIKSAGPSRVDRLGPYQLKNRENEQTYIDGLKQYEFKFITDKVLDVNKPFLINNKKYICRKLQYDCKTDGVSKQVKGSFYRLK